MHLVASLKATWTPRSPLPIPPPSEIHQTPAIAAFDALQFTPQSTRIQDTHHFPIANCWEVREEFWIERNGIVKLRAVFVCSSRFASSKHRHCCTWFEASCSGGGSFAFEIRWSACKNSPPCRKECVAGGSHGRCALGQAWHRFSELQDRVARNYPHFSISHKLLLLLSPTRLS